MKYFIMMHAADVLPPEELKPGMAHVVRLMEELLETGELISTEGLTSPRQAKIVQAKGNGSFDVTDGPFPEMKEFLIGYWLVDCESPERAYEIAARISSIPDKDGRPANMLIEVREVPSAPASDM